MNVNVLVLGDRVLFGNEALKTAGYSLNVTVENSPSGPNHYRVTERSLKLARAAETEGFDLVVIGNNIGTGRLQAQEIPAAVRDRVLIVFSDPPTERVTAMYRELGFSHFAERGNASGAEMLTMLEGSLW